MGVSYNMFPIRVIQSDDDFKNHIKSLKIIGNLDLNIIEDTSKYPTLSEIYDSLERARIKINSENMRTDEFALKEGKDQIIHSFSITDGIVVDESDFTIAYPKNSMQDEEIKTLVGIKSDLRILVKLLSSLSKKCGSFVILSPFEAFVIDKSKSFVEIWSKIESDLVEKKE
jgi:hypothetical protein